jgi:hypothetical protein
VPLSTAAVSGLKESPGVSLQTDRFL